MQKNKLLLTSALVGAAMFSTASVNAEMKVSGYAEYTHVMQSSDLTANVKPANQKIGQGVETDLVFSNTLDLGNGMKAAITANITNEAGATANSTGTGMGLDAMVLDIDTGKGFNFVMASSGFAPADGIGEVVPTVLDIAVDTGITGSADANNFDLGNTNSIGIKTGGLSVAYTPNFAAGVEGATGTFLAGGAGTHNSAYDIAYAGSFNGVGFKAGMHKAEANLAADSGQESHSYGVNYSVAGISVGAQYTEKQSLKVGTAAQLKIDQTTYGATYKVDDQITVGLTRSVDGTNTAGSPDQTATSFQIGYALGPIGVALAYTNVDNLAYTTGRDGSGTTLKVATKF